MPHTSVIYFHGIGQQRRYEEISLLVEALETQCRVTNAASPAGPRSALQSVTPKIEPGRPAGQNDVAFIHAVHTAGTTPPQTATYRFYETYWAPLTAEGISVFRVLRWTLRQMITGLCQRGLNWRFRQRLRRSSFLSLIDSLAGKTGVEPHAGDVHRLLDDYNGFDSLAGNASYPKGTFSEFVRFLTNNYKDKKDHLLARLLKLVKRWRRHDRILRLRTKLVCLTALLFCSALILGSGIAAFRAAAIIRRLLVLNESDLMDIAGTGSFTCLLLLIVIVCGRFLRTYVADIEFWATYEETDLKHKKRREILDLGFSLLQHVLLDDECERVVIIGHSLGSAIAYDTLLQAGRYNRARGKALPLDKIDSFVTMGSPIDKIYWFFESYQSRCFRYRKMVEELRGDIGTPPFAVNGIPKIYWLNLWDKMDPLSGSLETPSSDTGLEIRIDNYHVNFASLNPISCHCGYLRNPTALTLLTRVIFARHNPYRRRQDGCGFLGPGRIGTVARYANHFFIALIWATILLFAFLPF